MSYKYVLLFLIFVFLGIMVKNSLKIDLYKWCLYLHSFNAFIAALKNCFSLYIKIYFPLTFSIPKFVNIGQLYFISGVSVV